MIGIYNAQEHLPHMTNRFTNPVVVSAGRDGRTTTSDVTTSDVYGGGGGGVNHGNLRTSNNSNNMNNDNEIQPSLIHYKTEAAYHPCLLLTAIVSPIVFIVLGIILLVRDGFVLLIIVAAASAIAYLTLLPRSIELYKDSTIRIKNVMGITFFKVQIVDAELADGYSHAFCQYSTAFTGKVRMTRKNPICSCNREVIINPEHPEQFVAAVKEIVSSDTDDEREEEDDEEQQQRQQATRISKLLLHSK